MGDSLSILSDAIARNCAVVISLPSAGMLRHHRSRFLAQCADGFWIESVPAERALIDELIANQLPAAVSFKSGDRKIAFAQPMLRRDDNFQLNAQSAVEAILLAFPKEIQSIQRRSNYRVRIPSGCELSARAWRIPEQADIEDQPVAAAELSIQPFDISAGGLGAMILPKNNAPPKVLEGERLRILLSYREVNLILEARMRYARGKSPPDAIRAGIQFKKLEDDLPGRQNLAALTRIVGELQREEVRRTRLGLAKAS
jgi:c-di-GMP-binding flagellar brake protein YcgR